MCGNGFVPLVVRLCFGGWFDLAVGLSFGRVVLCVGVVSLIWMQVSVSMTGLM